ncbi:MAG: DUF6751 family protein [Oscillospiraceae bacterium]
MYTNADCTIFNAYYDKSHRCDSWRKTVIKGVYWEDASGENSQQTGLLNDCSAFVIIPKNADFGGKKYMKPKEYYYNSSDSIFTFAPNDIIIRGIYIGDFTSIKEINSLDDSHTILKASDFLYGSPSVQHWEVQSK